MRLGQWSWRSYGFLVAAALVGTLTARSMAMQGSAGKLARPKNPPASKFKLDAHVFGADEREAIHTDQYPWRVIGALHSRKADGKMLTCTATLVGRKWIVTAAHCLNSVTANDSAVFYANLTKGKFKHSSKLVRWWSGTGPIAQDAEYDYIERDWALAELEKPLGEKLGWMGMKEIPLDELPGMPIALVGYSADFQKGQTGGFAACEIQSAGLNGIFEHDCDSNPGASGGPVFVQDASDGQYYVIGIHTSQTQAAPTSLGPGVNGDFGDNDSGNFAISVRPAVIMLNRVK